MIINMRIFIVLVLLISTTNYIYADDTATRRSGYVWAVQRPHPDNVRNICFNKPNTCSFESKMVCYRQARLHQSGDNKIYFWQRQCVCANKNTIPKDWFIMPTEEVVYFCMEHAGRYWEPFYKTWASWMNKMWGDWASKSPTESNVKKSISSYKNGKRELEVSSKYFTSKQHQSKTKVGLR